jgi:AP-3 complex subunit mu
MIIAPSGRPLAAFANGTIACTSKISGVPDILLNLSTPSGRQNVNSVIELPVFHPCVRLARWREKPGEMSFVPPDGRFILAGYQVDLLPSQNVKSGQIGSTDLRLPIHVSVQKGLGPAGSEFEIQLLLTNMSGRDNASVLGSSSRGSGHLGGRGTPGFGGGLSGGSSTGPLDDVVVKVSLPPDVRNLSEIHANKGDTTYHRAEQVLEWQLLGKDCVPGYATLRCNVLGPLSDSDDIEGNGFRLGNDWDYTDDAYQSTPVKVHKETDVSEGQEESKKAAQNKTLMPRSINISFSCKGWLASGIKVESLIVDPRKSRGLGDGVKPYKGVKYLTISRGGIDKRC